MAHRTERRGYHTPTPSARKAEEDVLAVIDDFAPLLDSLGIRFQRGNGGRKPAIST